MKRLFSLPVLLALFLPACDKAPETSAAAKNIPAKETPAVTASASTSKTDVPATPRVQVAFSPATRALVSAQDVPLLEQINEENIKVASAAMPSIVRISATMPADPRMQLFGKELPFQFHFGPGVPHGEIDNSASSFGSGVIISKDGYVVTNNHVVEGATDLVVQLADKRNFSARVVAADSLVDVAVLKIDAADLPALPWGDSDKVQVGEQVFAIGNPFNLDDSVSKGIVSAKGRNLESSNNYEDYIQTDAAINPGNSGGALINIYGELIGINAAIASSSRVNMGVGFAIPSNLVRYAVEGLLKQGRLVRGYLGVKLPLEIDKGVQDMLGLKTDEGALLADVQQDSPADKAGLRAFDFITEVDGHKVTSIAGLRLVVAQIPIGKEVKVAYIRNGEPQSTTVKISEPPPDTEAANRGDDNGDTPVAPPGAAPAAPENVFDGMTVADLDDKSRKKFNIDNVIRAGVVVSAVEEGSLVDSKGMLPGDVIESACVNRGSTHPIISAKDFSDIAKGLKPDQSVVLLVHHGKASSFIYLSPHK
jgi:serine protease Do